ncbi:MAG: DUF4153 domain-containing protein [Bacteroidetes bacterium]|nr:DUF4153 domain-containing protein [Bacteroidota bacterium]
MKIPSLTLLYEDAMETLQRFPFVILVSILGSILMMYLIEIEAEPGRDYQRLYNVVMCCGLGISFLLSLTLRNEVFKLPTGKNYLIQGAGIILLAVYYFTLPADLGLIEITRFLLFALGFHLLVSFTAFMNSDVEHQQNIDAFWRFNKLFFLRILTSVLFSGVLYAGLSVAILSFNELFEMHIKGKIYAQLFFLILGVFNTWFFLAGIPENLNDFYQEEVYPKALKLFTQFVLLPLVTIYLVILYLYMGKIIILWNLPVGWVSYLILCFSIAGIFSLLLIYPIRNYEENKWIKVFSKSFYIALLPLIVLLFIAILTRLFEYGITEKRYFVFVLACWLTFISLYFLFSKKKNIKLIPITLCLLCFITSFGPWGAFSVSQRSQMSRLEKLLTDNKILVDGKIKPMDKTAHQNISDNDEGNISSIVHFFAERKSIDVLQKWFDSSLDSINSKNSYSQPGDVMKLMGLQYKSYFRENYNSEKKNYFNYYFDRSTVTKISDYDYYSPLSVYRQNEEKDFLPDSTYVIKIDSNKIGITLLREPAMMRVDLNGAEISVYNFNPLIDSLKAEDLYKKLPADKGNFIIDNNKIKLNFNLESMGGYFKGKTPMINSIAGNVLIKIKK